MTFTKPLTINDAVHRSQVSDLFNLLPSGLYRRLRSSTESVPVDLVYHNQNNQHLRALPPIGNMRSILQTLDQALSPCPEDYFLALNNIF